MIGVVLFGSALFSQTPLAHAQQGRTAIVNLAQDQKAGQQAATQLRRYFEKHPDLNPLRLGSLSRSLEESITGQTTEIATIARAQAALATARTELGDFRYSRALSATRKAEKQLLTLHPSQKQRVLLARVAFISGQINLRGQNRGLARASFELALRLDPGITAPDPGQYAPDIVSVFSQASARLHTSAVGSLDVRTNYDATQIYLNGHPIGRSPIAITVPAGSYYVAAISPDHQITAQRVEVGEGDNVELYFDLVPIPPREFAVRLRQQFLELNEEEKIDRVGEIAVQVAALTGAQTTLIIRTRELGNPEVALFRRRNSHGTPFRPLIGDPAGLLALLTGIGEPSPSELYVPASPVQPLHKRPEVLLASAGVVVALVVGGLLVVLTSNSSPNSRTGIPVGFESIVGR